MRGELLRVRDQVPVGEIAEVTQLRGRLAGPQIAVGRLAGPQSGSSRRGRGGRGVPPGAPGRLGVRRRNVTGWGGHVVGWGSGDRGLRHRGAAGRGLARGGTGRRDVRDGRGAGLFRGRGGHLGRFIARAPSGAEHIRLGCRVVHGIPVRLASRPAPPGRPIRSYGIRAGHRDRLVVSFRSVGLVPVVTPGGASTLGFLGDRGVRHGCLIPFGYVRRAGDGTVRAWRHHVRARGVFRACGHPVRDRLGFVLVRCLIAAEGRGDLLERGLRLGLVSSGVFGLGDDIAAYDVAGSPPLAVLVLGHSNLSPVSG